MSDEQDLLRCAVEGDREAFRTLLERYGGQVWAGIDARIGPQWRSLIDAEDVMQVTYIEAFLQAGELTARDGAGFAGWLRRIAENNLRDAMKELQRKKRPHPARRVHASGGDDSYITLVELLGSSTGTPSRHVARQEAAEVIDAKLQCLPEAYAQVIRLYDLQGLDIAQTAQRMQRSPGAVHMLRVRAHDHLRAILGAETDFFTDVA